MGQWSLCSQLLLLPHGVPPTPGQTRFTFSHSEHTAIWRVLNTAAVGYATRPLGGGQY